VATHDNGAQTTDPRVHEKQGLNAIELSQGRWLSSIDRGLGLVAGQCVELGRVA
jgi:hypothetical protein